jgi:hypothetical protein
MSTIGIQSTANQVHENGLSGRVPYDVGRSIRMWQTTPIMATAQSIAKLAGGSVDCLCSRLSHSQTIPATMKPRPITPSGP